MSHPTIDGVIFDLGGVVLPSPFEAWADYERELGLEVGFVRGVVAASGDDGAWARHERGELDFGAFVEAFDAELEAAGGGGVSAIEVMARLASKAGPRPEMISAVRTIRSAGFRVGALTNNWHATNAADTGASDLPRAAALSDLFDVIVESAVEGLRKPDPAIYRITCERLGVEPARTAFLDDLGVNLKPARAMGMTTIKVVDPADALDELGAVLGVSLRDPDR